MEIFSGGRGLDLMIFREYFLLNFFLLLPSFTFLLNSCHE